ncbi:MAG: tetratricopeptide repeat protein [Thaumarchaeota archaeon]|nr:tetratricopeptide repeat protein [Nitrososphaerota archaeon]
MKWYEYILIVATAIWIYRLLRGEKADEWRMTQEELDAISREGTLELLKHLSLTSPDDAGVRFGLGYALCRAGRHLEALEAFGHAGRLDPSLNVGAGRGRALLGLGRVAEALAELERAVAAEPKNAEAHADLGSALQRLGRHGEALESVDRAISIDPDDADLHARRGHILKSLGRSAESGAALERAARAGSATAGRARP